MNWYCRKIQHWRSNHFVVQVFMVYFYRDVPGAKCDICLVLLMAVCMCCSGCTEEVISASAYFLAFVFTMSMVMNTATSAMDFVEAAGTTTSQMDLIPCLVAVQLSQAFLCLLIWFASLR